MTTYADNVIQKQLNHSMIQEQDALLTTYAAEQDGDVLMIDATGLSIYDAASEADETGVWVFLGNAINQGSLYGDWQQNPSAEHTLPDEANLNAANKAETMNTGAKWLLGGLTAVGLLALGGTIGGGGSHHEPHQNAADQPIPKPRALVQQFSAAENPTNPDERAAVVQAEAPNEKINAQPENHVLLHEPVIAALDEAKTDFSHIAHATENTHYLTGESLRLPSEWLNVHDAPVTQVI